MMNTKKYSKLLRETAKRNGVELLKGQWCDGMGPGRSTRGPGRLVTFKVNTTAGDFDQFIKDLSVETLLRSGEAPRFTPPRKDVEPVLMQNGHYSHWERKETDHEFTYVKFNTVVV